MKWYSFLMICSVMTCHHALAQDSIATQLPQDYLEQVSKRVATLSGRIEESSDKSLATLKRLEARLKRKVERIDSSLALEVFGDLENKYLAFNKLLQQPEGITEYIPYLDTLKTALNFLSTYQSKIKPTQSEVVRIKKAASEIGILDERFSNALHIVQLINERKNLLNSQLSKFPFSRQLKKIKKQSYYYRAKVMAYKDAVNDSKRRERLAIELLSKTKPFKNFMAKHSQLSRLFLLPGNNDEFNEAADVNGLQTRASTTALVKSKLGTGLDAQTIFQKTVQEIPRQLSSIKELALRYSMGSIGNGSEAVDMANFKPNSQKTKTFVKRLEYGFNMQSQTARLMFPVTMDLGLSLGYAMNDKSVLGIGVAYKSGLGSGWKDINFSSQGIGFRSYIDYQIKGSFFLSGGYEKNHWNSFSSIAELKSYSAWQSSGLLGLSKKYSVSKRFKGKAQLLWDFLSYQQIPKTQALLFRVGYNFN